MRFVTVVRLGIARVRRRPGLVALVWLASLVPALLLVSLAYSDLDQTLSYSTFAAEALGGNRFGVWLDYLHSPANHLQPLAGSIKSRLLLVVLLQIAVSAGLVEALFGRARRADHPFLAGIGRHGWRFARAAVWFGLTAAVTVGVFAGLITALRRPAIEAGNGTLSFWGTLALVALAVLALIPVKLAYDLARVAAAAHDQGSTLRGFLRALGHSVRHPLVLVPTWLVFAVGGLALHLGYLALRGAWMPAGPGGVLLLVLVQQLLLFLHAYLRTGLWAAEIAYFQAIGEPRWCRPRQPRRRAAATSTESHPVASPAPPVRKPPAADPAPSA
jgi:hypothetical protein